MSAPASVYVGANPDPWIEDSFVVYSGPTSSISVDLTVKNFKGDRSVYQIVLMIVTNNLSVISSIYVNGTSIPLPWTYGPDQSGPPMYSDPGAVGGTYLGEMPPHGVYNDPSSAWIEFRSGKNLTARNTPGDSVLFQITINFTSPDPGRVKIHFDAYGWIEESGKKPVIIDDTLDAAFSPFSHDFTILIPELSLPLLATTSIGLCGYLLLKRKLTKT